MRPTSALLFLPISVASLVAFTAGMGLILSALALYFRDVTHILEVVLTAWFYATPIFYGIEFVPEQYRWIFQLNPLVHLTALFREPIYYQRIPSMEGCLIGIALGLITLVVGILVFR